MITVGISAINRPYPIGVNLQIGRDVYVDRGYTYTAVPSLVQGASYIQTANNDKTSSGDGFLTFTLDQPSIVYVAHDVRITSKPSWLAEFTDTGENLVTSDTTLHLFSKPYPSGQVSLGGNESSGNSMYTVIITINPEKTEEPVPKSVNDIVCELLTVCEGVPPSVWAEFNKPKPFRVFENMLYVGKPDLTSYGIAPIENIDAARFGPVGWFHDQDALPDKHKVQNVMNQVQTPQCFLDIEHWAFKGDIAVVRANMMKYMTILGWAQEARPDLKIGCYLVPPLREYYPSFAAETDPSHIAWLDNNSNLAPFAEMVDIFFPSLYTFANAQEDWVKYAKANIEAAKRYRGDKPVYAFLWPQYHPSATGIGGQYMDGSFWRLQLETVKAHADGVVIWGRPDPWDEQAPWWLETKAFMQGL